MDKFSEMGLVLEGGGMRGVFTCGVIDYLLDAGIRFPYVIGVSAGACNGLSYMSGQRGRARYSNIEMLDKYHYIGLKYLASQHSILDQNLLYNEFPAKLSPFDFAAYRANPTRFEMVTTDCLTGRACYLSEKNNLLKLNRIAKASSSLPYVCPVQIVNRTPMLDGGIVDSIPLERAISQGYERCVVVLTRNRGYRPTERDVKIPRFIYNRFPRLRAALSQRHDVYRQQLELIERMEDEGRIIAIRPIRPMEVGRIERNIDKLSALYEEGYACAKRALEPLSDVRGTSLER